MWMFLVIMFQILTIIAFDGFPTTLDRFQVVLSVGPTFAIMNFIECKWLFGRAAHVWCLYNCKRLGYFKDFYSVFLVGFEFNICNICLFEIARGEEQARSNVFPHICSCVRGLCCCALCVCFACQFSMFS